MDGMSLLLCDFQKRQKRDDNVESVTTADNGQCCSCINTLFGITEADNEAFAATTEIKLQARETIKGRPARL